MSNPKFKYGKLSIVDTATREKVNKLVAGVNYDAVGIVEFPAAGTYPYIDQWEEGKAVAFDWDAGDIAISGDGLFEISTTFSVDASLIGAKMTFAETLGADRGKRTKFKVVQ